MSDLSVQIVGDGRSVAELLLNADTRARSALWYVGPDHAQSRLRTWGEVIEAAASAWAAIPDPDRDPVMQQINARARQRNPRYPCALATGRRIPLPDSVRTVLLGQCNGIIGATRNAASAVTAADTSA
ncbi:hypothetical protein, partial [Phycicoccus flavus]|uniref:hypothetical protein n=1 Tax=Phycicoccus flavus TaxID=2502783 RepID=UPI00197BF285